MNVIIISDLHLGSPFSHGEVFERFLEDIPEDHELVLNGDIVDNLYTKLKPSEKRVLDLIEQFSFHQRVVWVQGNHDNGYLPDRFGKVEFKRLHSIGRRLLITHGDDFDEIMPRNQLFIKVFKLMHWLRVKLGAKPVHVAEYAKKWKSLYGVLRKNVMMNAVKCARVNGYEAVTCGHTHYAEDMVVDGIRYLNTGAWTENPSYFLHITADQMILNRLEDKPYRIQIMKTFLVN
jgi:UDP-2,3-diacylglucosamine pyrophosphatase LpxH